MTAGSSTSFVAQALRNEPLTVYGDGQQTRSFCYVDDLVEALMALMASAAKVTGPVNLGNPEELPVLDVAAEVIELTCATSSIRFQPLPQDDPRRRPVIDRARALLRWQPRVPLEVGLKRTIADFRARLAPTRPSGCRLVADPDAGASPARCRPAARTLGYSRQHACLQRRCRGTRGSGPAFPWHLPEKSRRSRCPEPRTPGPKPHRSSARATMLMLSTLAVSMAALAGCNTMEGAGEDVSAAGRADQQVGRGDEAGGCDRRGAKALSLAPSRLDFRCRSSHGHRDRRAVRPLLILIADVWAIINVVGSRASLIARQSG